MADWGRRVLLGSMLGATLGILLGLGLARIFWPTSEPTPMPSPTLIVSKGTATPVAPTTAPALELEQGVLMVSALYALDGDVDRAVERLQAMGLDDPAGTLAQMALDHALVGSSQIATDLATLAAALGDDRKDLLAYVATATATATPSPTPTSTPTHTPTQTPSPTPTTLPTEVPTLAPAPTATRRPPTRRPPTATPRPPVATPLPLTWDSRVDMLNSPIKLIPAEVEPGQRYWRLVTLEWKKPGEGGDTQTYITIFDEEAQPVWGQEVRVENGGGQILYTEPKPGVPSGTHFTMYNTLNSYQVYVGGDLPSERVAGLGLGEWLGGRDHTSFVLVFQRTKK
jgi:hypothetical protein